MICKTFTSETLRNILWNNYGGMVVEDDLIFKGRSGWALHRIVFRVPGDPSFYEVRYTISSSHSGSGRERRHHPCFGGDDVECHVVEPHDGTFVEYRRES